jgi:hypothetical protein
MVMRAVVKTRLTTSRTDTTWIVVFGSSLDAPTLPSIHYRYRGGSLDIPPHLSAISIRALQQSREMIAARANPTTDAGAALGGFSFTTGICRGTTPSHARRVTSSPPDSAIPRA